MSRLAITVLSVFILGCSGRAQEPVSLSAASPKGAGDEVGIARNLSMMVRAQDLSTQELATLKEELAQGRFTFETFVDRQLHDERFAQVVAPDVLLASAFAEPLFHLLSGGMLSQTVIGDAPAYHLGKPCQAADVVHVSPWWDVGGTVRVCSSSHAPSVFVDKTTGQKCSGSNWEERTDASSCGCGPNLMRCWRDSEHRMGARESMKREVRDTLRGIVEANRPLTDLYTANETIRDTTADLMYQRWRVELGQQAELAVPDANVNAFRPRHELSPGQHTGILTSHMMLWRRDSRRSRMDSVQEDMWCVESTSIGVGAERIHDFMKTLATSDVRYGDEAWKDLAQRDFCSSCHARMDYGWQFFKGFQRPVLSRHYQPEEATTDKTLPVYFANINDKRGDIPATPKGYAAFAVSQPEFGSCMTKKVGSYVLGRPTESETQSLATAYEQHGDLRSMMKTALQLYIARESGKPKPIAPASETLPKPGSAAAEEVLALSKESVERLEDGCFSLCHSNGLFDRPGELRELSRAEISQTLAYLSNELMPLNMDMAKDDRRRLILSLIDDAWHDNQELANTARSRYLGLLEAPTLHNTGVFLPASIDAPGGVEQFLIPSQTVGANLRRLSPSTAALLYSQVASRCVATLQQSGQKSPTQSAIESCIANAIDPQMLTH